MHARRRRSDVYDFSTFSVVCQRGSLTALGSAYRRQSFLRFAADDGIGDGAVVQSERLFIVVEARFDSSVVIAAVRREVRRSLDV